MPFGLDQEEDPITFEAVRGTKEAPNTQEILENVPLNLGDGNGMPNFLSNPVRNMRVTLSRSRLITRKRARHLIEAITDGRQTDSVHVPMENTDRVFWQAVMRQNTVIPPLRRITLNQYIRILMYGEAVQMGAAVGAIGRPYVEYFSDPFIIGLEDDNANLMYHILQELERGGLPQEYYVFNTGGVGADTNDEASGPVVQEDPQGVDPHVTRGAASGGGEIRTRLRVGPQILPWPSWTTKGKRYWTSGRTGCPRISTANRITPCEWWS